MNPSPLRTPLSPKPPSPTPQHHRDPQPSNSTPNTTLGPIHTYLNPPPLSQFQANPTHPRAEKPFPPKHSGNPNTPSPSHHSPHRATDFQTAPRTDVHTYVRTDGWMDGQSSSSSSRRNRRGEGEVGHDGGAEALRGRGGRFWERGGVRVCLLVWTGIGGVGSGCWMRVLDEKGGVGWGEV